MNSYQNNKKQKKKKNKSMLLKITLTDSNKCKRFENAQPFVLVKNTITPRLLLFKI